MTITEKRNLAKWKKQRKKPVIPPFKWSHQKESAALLLATEPNLTIPQVAQRAGCSPRAIDGWKVRPEFQGRIKELFDTWCKQIRSKGIALKERRLLSYLEAYEAIQVIKADRAAEYAESGLGGKSGYVVKEMKTVAGEPVAHFVFDRALMAEERELKKQLAIELGEFEQKLEVSGPDGGPIEMQLSGPDGNPIRSLGPEVLMEVLALMRSRVASPTIDVEPAERKTLE